MENNVKKVETVETVVVNTDSRPAYETPRVTVMDEAEVLKTFQFTSAAASWWTM